MNLQGQIKSEQYKEPPRRPSGDAYGLRGSGTQRDGLGSSYGCQWFKVEMQSMKMIAIS